MVQKRSNSNALSQVKNVSIIFFFLKSFGLFSLPLPTSKRRYSSSLPLLHTLVERLVYWSSDFVQCLVQ